MLYLLASLNYNYGFKSPLHVQGRSYGLDNGHAGQDIRARSARKIFGVMNINEIMIALVKWRYLDNRKIRLTECLSGQVRYTESVSDVF